MGEARLDDNKIGRMGFWTSPTDAKSTYSEDWGKHHSNEGEIRMTSPSNSHFMG